LDGLDLKMAILPTKFEISLKRPAHDMTMPQKAAAQILKSGEEKRGVEKQRIIGSRD
jgi:hypothetical protein